MKLIITWNNGDEDEFEMAQLGKEEIISMLISKGFNGTILTTENDLQFINLEDARIIEIED